ncbi:MFS transporter [Nonomuraea thailandensis]
MMSNSELGVQAPDSCVWTPKYTVILSVLCAAQVLDGIDVTVVNVALPSIETELGFTAASLSWVVNAYMVVFGGFLLLGGRAGDLLGRRRVFLAGLALFAVSSLGAGLAASPAVLVAARAVQGLAAALIAPMTLALIAVTFPPGTARNRAFAIWGAAYGVSSAVGLLVGGVLANGPGWRWIFLVNIPIGLLLLLATVRYVPADRPARRHHRFDLVGALTSTGGVSLLAYAVLQAPTGGWLTVTTLGLLIAAVVLLGYFALHEWRFAAEPLLDTLLLRSRSVTGANVVTAVRGGAMFAVFYFATLYQQQVLHQSPLETGLAYLPMTLVLIVAAGLGPVLVRAAGIRVVLTIGSLIAAGGLLWFAQMSTGGSLWAGVIGPSIVVSIGFAVMVVPTTIAALTEVAKAHSGIASALLNVSLQLGGALGLAVLSTAATTRNLSQAGTHPDTALVEGYAFAFALASALMAVTAVLAMVFFREQGRGQQVNVAELQKESIHD